MVAPGLVNGCLANETEVAIYKENETWTVLGDTDTDSLCSSTGVLTALHGVVSIGWGTPHADAVKRSRELGVEDLPW